MSYGRLDGQYEWSEGEEGGVMSGPRGEGGSSAWSKRGGMGLMSGPRGEGGIL